MGRGRYPAAIVLWLAALAAMPAIAGDSPTKVAQQLQQAAASYAKGDIESAWFGFWVLAQKGDPLAQFNLAQLYRLGQGIPVDLQRARYWYAEAAARGNGPAQFNLGLMYEHGYGTPVDRTDARAWYRRAAAQNIAEAVEGLQRLEGQARLPGPRRRDENGTPP